MDEDGFALKLNFLSEKRTRLTEAEIWRYITLSGRKRSLLTFREGERQIIMMHGKPHATRQKVNACLIKFEESNLQKCSTLTSRMESMNAPKEGKQRTWISSVYVEGGGGRMYRNLSQRCKVKQSKRWSQVNDYTSQMPSRINFGHLSKYLSKHKVCSSLSLLSPCSKDEKLAWQ